MKFKEPDFIFTPFQAFDLTEEIQLIKGREYCLIQDLPDEDGYQCVQIVGLDLPDQTEHSINAMKLEFLANHFYEEGATLIPFVLKDVLDCRTILAETLPSRNTIRLGLHFDVRLRDVMTPHIAQEQSWL